MGGPIFSREDRVFDPTLAELFRPSSLSAKRMGSREWDDHLSIMIIVQNDNLPCFRILKANVFRRQIKLKARHQFLHERTCQNSRFV
jgi:hypothetical protein